MAPVLKNALVYTGGNVANAAIPFLLLPVLTRILTPAEYGVIAMFMAIIVVLNTFTGLNVHGAIMVRYFDRDAPDLSRYIGSCLAIVAAGSLAAFAITGLFREPIAAFTSVPVGWVLVAVAVAGMNNLAQIQLTLWMARERAMAFGLFQFARTILEFALAIYLVVVLLQGVEGRLWSRAAAVAVFAVLALALLWRNPRGSYRPEKACIRDALSFGLPLIPHTIGLFLVSVGDRFIINATLGVDQTGIYTVAVQLGMGMALVMDAFNKAFVPWLYGRLRDGEPAELRRIVAGTWFYFALVLLAAGLVALLSGWIVRFIAGPGFDAAAAPLAWIALGQAFHGMYLMVTNYTFYARKTVYLAGVTLSTGVIGLILTLALVSQKGIVGAGIAFAIAMFLKFVFTWVLSQKAYPMPWFGILSRRDA